MNVDRVRTILARITLVIIALVLVYCGYAVLSGTRDPSEALMILLAGTVGFPLLSWLVLMAVRALADRYKETKS